jgi:hypothetical protein
MNFEVLINLFDDHNEASILLTEKYKPKEVIFLCEEEKEGQLDKLREYYKTRFDFVQFKSIIFNNFQLDELDKFIRRYKDSNSLINLTSGRKIDCLILYQIAVNYHIPSQYIDIEKEILINFTKENIKIIKDSFVDLNVEDVIKSIGGSIVVDSTDICNTKAVEILTDLIAANLKTWNKFKYRIYDPQVFIHDENNPAFIKINTITLTKEERQIYNKILELLKHYEQINYTWENNTIKIHFLNNYIKSFIFKSGTWLEAFTKKIVSQIEGIDDVKSGVLFLWNDEEKKVKNEIDVVAIKDSILICISCKDSNKYDEVALNELNVYADQLGGENVIKILVATKPPLKNSVIERAKEMDIHIILYDGDKNRFIKNIKDKIIKYNK